MSEKYSFYFRYFKLNLKIIKKTIEVLNQAVIHNAKGKIKSCSKLINTSILQIENLISEFEQKGKEAGNE